MITKGRSDIEPKYQSCKQVQAPMMTLMSNDKIGRDREFELTRRKAVHVSALAIRLMFRIL